MKFSFSTTHLDALVASNEGDSGFEKIGNNKFGGDGFGGDGKKKGLLDLNDDTLNDILTFLSVYDMVYVLKTTKKLRAVIQFRIKCLLNESHCEALLRPIFPNKVFDNEMHFLSFVEARLHTPQIACGDSHTVVITKQRHLFAWGKNDAGQLGIGNLENVATPKRLREIRNARAVAAGRDHTTVLNMDGTVELFGGNISDKPVLVQGELKGKSVSQIAAGDGFCTFVTTSGQLYVSGAGLSVDYEKSDKQTSINTPLIEPKLIALGDLDSKVVHVAAGKNHIVILTRTGNVYTCGNNEDYQLGQGDQLVYKVPTLVKSLQNQRIVMVSAGLKHSIAMAADGSLYSWGNNVKGQCGIPAKRFIILPTFVELPHDSANALFIASGYYNTLILTAQNKVLAFGDSSFGQLANESSFFASSAPNASFSVPNNNEDRLIQIAGGGSVSAVLTETGNLYMAGNSLLLGQNVTGLTRVSRPRMISLNDEASVHSPHNRYYYYGVIQKPKIVTIDEKVVVEEKKSIFSKIKAKFGFSMKSPKSLLLTDSNVKELAKQIENNEISVSCGPSHHGKQQMPKVPPKKNNTRTRTRRASSF